ncbi:MAG: hypothetical protein KF805_07130 [Phycisphaeraceae bacterium]|nr:hypothetical protein [Phycisphaeraceae bacterium]
MRPLAAALIMLLTFGNCLGEGESSLEIEAAITQFRTGKAPTASELAAIEACITSALAAHPADERARYAKALFDRFKGERKSAKESLEALVKQSPAVAEYHATYGTLCFEVIGSAGTFEKMGLASTGRAEYEKAIELDSTLLEPRVGLGRFFLMAPGYAGGSYRKAEVQANALIAIPDGTGEVYGRSLLADIYADKGEWAKMDEQYQLAESCKGAGANPSVAMRGHAQVLLTKKKDPAAALVVIERYQVAAAPDDAAPWYLAGEAKKALGDDNGAIAGFARVVEINPQAANSRFALAELLEKNRRYTEAAQQYTEFAARCPQDSRAGNAAAAAARCEARTK